MLDVTVNTLTRGGEFLYATVSKIATIAPQYILGVDSRTEQKYIDVVNELKREFPHIEVIEYTIKDPFKDLVAARNDMLRCSKQQYVWIVDDDEVYPENQIELLKTYISKDVGYAVQCFAIWNGVMAHKSTSKLWIDRIFKNPKNLKWWGSFGKERLYNDENVWMCSKRNYAIKRIPIKYIHFTHVKEATWRVELNKHRRADGRKLIKLPENIKEEVRKIYEKAYL